MTPTWHSEDKPVVPGTGPLGLFRAVTKGVALLVLLLLGSFATLVIRIVEFPVHGPARPWTGWITVIVCRAALALIGLRLRHTGSPMTARGIFVANHSSWLDIFVLNSGAPLVFVSKAEVARWPGIGWLARLTGTVFVERAAREAGQQKAILESRIDAGDRLLLFPEGTSTDGQRVLPFKPTLFAAAMSGSDLFVQPVTVAYEAPAMQDRRFYGWWGDMDFGPHLVQVLAARRGGRVVVTWHPPLGVAQFADRKTLAKEAEHLVRSAHPGASQA